MPLWWYSSSGCWRFCMRALANAHVLMVLTCRLLMMRCSLKSEHTTPNIESSCGGGKGDRCFRAHDAHLQVADDALLVKVGACHAKYARQATGAAQPAGATCYVGGGVWQPCRSS
eukprot:1157459-Pelagomonas_calceolata.AAC.8